MEENIVDQSPAKVVNKRPRQRVLLRLLGGGLLLSLALGSFVALDYLTPRAPGRPQGITNRVSWYLQSGQSRADARTLACLLQFVMGTESDSGNVDNYSTLPVAEKTTPSLPKS